MSGSLGGHFHLTTEEKNGGGNLWIFSSLIVLKPKSELWSVCLAAARELEQFKHQKEDKNWDKWESGFTIYT